MPDYRLAIRLSEPLFCGSRYAISNEMKSLDFIPGTTLRGALAHELRYAGRNSDIPLWFAAAGPLWTPALPALSDRVLERLDDPEAILVPMPLSFHKEKSDTGSFHGGLGVFNSLHGDLPLDSEQYAKFAGLPPPDARTHQQWTRVSAKWLVVSKGRPISEFSVPRPASMHVGLHYGRQANRDEALFSRRELARGANFVAWVSDPANVLSNRPSTATMGKRTSAGNGAVFIRWSPGKFPWAGAGATGHSYATVQFISDAIVPDNCGRFLQGLHPDQWKRILGVPVTVERAAVATRSIRNWSTAWGLPRQHLLAISAGCVYRLRAAVPGPEFGAALDRLAANGIGLLRHEGFGWLSVNPPWLSERFYPPAPSPLIDKERQRRREPGPAPMPGLESVDRPTVVATYQKVKDAADRASSKNVKREIADLASYAARVTQPSDVLKYLEGLAQRGNPRGWHDLLDLIRPHLAVQDMSNGPIELTRFYLSALETLINEETLL